MVFKCKMPNKSFVVVVRCSSMYETLNLLLHRKNQNNLTILRFCLKYQNLHVFTEKRLMEADSGV